MKKTFGLMLMFCMLFVFLTPNVTAIKDNKVKRYTVLVLDTSGSAKFLDGNNQVIYTADTAIEYVKQSANQFIDDILKARGENYIAIVSYKSTAQKITDFTNDGKLLKKMINDLSYSNSDRSIANGLNMANDLMSTITNDDVIKNVVLVTTGMTNDGNYSYSGRYNNSTIGSDWRRTDNQIRLYAYANTAYSASEVVKEKANLYVLGIFQTMSGMPEQGQAVAEFFRLTAQDLASSQDCFYDIEDPRDVGFVFGEIVDDITMIDSDGDGLYDDWETNGIDVDGDGSVDLHLEKMGADPNIPDVFVEVDWMVQPQKKQEFIKIQPELSLAPSSESMRIVYEAFKNHGINLHIDVGPNSIDFVTGKKWGKLSGGNKIPYEENFELGNENGKPTHWNETIENNFNMNDRENVFKYCLFVNTYNGEKSSGITAGNYFIVANQDWLRKTGNTGIAGTFMHELGHALGLGHGGRGKNGIYEENYKPNYLSIMNYLFQTSGLSGTNEINYSDYELPDLNEKSLFESHGIDPNGITKDKKLGTKIKISTTEEIGKEIQSIAQTPIDYNNILGIETIPVSVDLNKDGKFGILTSPNDWKNLVFNKNDGHKSQLIRMAGISEWNKSMEVDLAERLKNGLLANEGTGFVETIGPFTLLEGYKNQGTFLRVSNLHSKDTSFTLVVEGNDFVESFSTEVKVKGSKDEISFEDIRIPIKDELVHGTYFMKVILKNPNIEDKVYEFNLEVYEPTDTELKKLKKLLDDESTPIPEHIRNEYQDILEQNGNQRNIQTFEICLFLGCVLVVLGVFVFCFIKLKRKRQRK